MSAITVTATVRPDGSLVVEKLPFPPGQQVKMTIYPDYGADTESRDVTHVEFDVIVDFPDSKPPAE